MNRQMSLPFAMADGYAATDFCPAPSNALAREWLARPEGWTNGRLILWGAAGCGKTHLLHVWAATQNAVLLDGAALRGLPARLENPVALDDSDAVPDPRAFLHLLNMAAEAAQPVLLAARLPPARQMQKLADLGSRLRASLAVEIGPAEDDLLDMMLTRLAAERQLTLSPSVRNFLLTHLPRTPAALREALARLDRAALDSGKKITRALAVDLLADMTNPETGRPDFLPGSSN